MYFVFFVLCLARLLFFLLIKSLSTFLFQFCQICTLYGTFFLRVCSAFCYYLTKGITHPRKLAEIKKSMDRGISCSSFFKLDKIAIS